MNSGRPKGRSIKTYKNKIRQMTKVWNKSKKLQTKIPLKNYLEKIKKSNTEKR